MEDLTAIAVAIVFSGALAIIIEVAGRLAKAKEGRMD